MFFYFLSFGGFLALTAWLPTFWHGMYGSTLREAGLLTAAFSLLSALVRVPGGLLSDRISIRYALHGNFLLMLVGVLGLSFSTTFALSLVFSLAVAVGMGLQNAIVFKLLPRYVPQAVGGASGWVGGLGALGGFVIPPLIGAVTGAVGGSTGYARGFLPVAVLVVLALPAVTVAAAVDRAHGRAVRTAGSGGADLIPGGALRGGPARRAAQPASRPSTKATLAREISLRARPWLMVGVPSPGWGP